MNVQCLNIRCVWGLLWVSICYAQRWGYSQTELQKLATAHKAPEICNPKRPLSLAILGGESTQPQHN